MYGQRSAVLYKAENTVLEKIPVKYYCIFIGATAIFKMILQKHVFTCYYRLLCEKQRTQMNKYRFKIILFQLHWNTT